MHSVQKIAAMRMHYQIPPFHAFSVNWDGVRLSLVFCLQACHYKESSDPSCKDERACNNVRKLIRAAAIREFNSQSLTKAQMCLNNIPSGSKKKACLILWFCWSFSKTSIPCSCSAE